MKRTLRIIALLIAIGALVFWAATGANRGWTKTQVQVKTGHDEFLQEDIMEWKKTFIPGVDFLGAAFAAAGIATGASFLFRTRKTR
jgi:hypothetical protein